MRVNKADSNTNFKGYIKDTEFMRNTILEAARYAASGTEKELSEARRFFNTLTLIKGDVSDNVLKIESVPIIGANSIRAKYGNIETWKSSYESPIGFISAIGERLFGKTAIEIPTTEVEKSKKLYTDVANALNKLFISAIK